MLIKNRSSWFCSESDVTSESAYFDRRSFLMSAVLPAATVIVAQKAWAIDPIFTQNDPSSYRYPVKPNETYTVDESLTDEYSVTHYNNFYEFGSHKNISSAAQKLPIRPWTVTIDGMVEQPMTIDIDTLLDRVTLQERIYRLRCVEAWAMVVPWSGFPFRELIELARPLGSAQYVRMETFMNPEVASGQRGFWYPWPYVEGLTMAEAMNDLTFLVTGLYGKTLLPQNGAPLRLAVPWKYGFKSIKSIVRFTFTEERPRTFWDTVAGNEYGFWANVNPDVPHPRWRQSHERMIDTGEYRQTVLFNGYAEQVAHLYRGLEEEALFR